MLYLSDRSGMKHIILGSAFTLFHKTLAVTSKSFGKSTQRFTSLSERSYFSPERICLQNSAVRWTNGGANSPQASTKYSLIFEEVPNFFLTNSAIIFFCLPIEERDFFI